MYIKKKHGTLFILWCFRQISLPYVWLFSIDNWQTIMDVETGSDGGLGDSGQVCLCLCGLPSGPRCRWRDGWWMELIEGEAQCRVALSVLQPAGLSAWCVCCLLSACFMVLFLSVLHLELAHAALKHGLTPLSSLQVPSPVLPSSALIFPSFYSTVLANTLLPFSYQSAVCVLRSITAPCLIQTRKSSLETQELPVASYP